MTENEFNKLLQKHLAEVSITNSALRNQGAKGLVSTARQFCSKLRIRKFNVYSQEKFNRVLNRDTRSLMSKFPTGAKNNWGAARKSLNLFLREVLYNNFLSRHFNTNVINFLEVPLDKQVAQAIKKNYKKKIFPSNFSIKSLQKEMSDEYQKTAKKIASELGIPRIHLDLIYWRN